MLYDSFVALPKTTFDFSFLFQIRMGSQLGVVALLPGLLPNQAYQDGRAGSLQELPLRLFPPRCRQFRGLWSVRHQRPRLLQSVSRHDLQYDHSWGTLPSAILQRLDLSIGRLLFFQRELAAFAGPEEIPGQMCGAHRRRCCRGIGLAPWGVQSDFEQKERIRPCSDDVWVSSMT